MRGLRFVNQQRMSLFVCEKLGVCVFVLVFKIRKSGDEFMFVNRGNYCHKLELSINIYDKVLVIRLHVCVYVHAYTDMPHSETHIITYAHAHSFAN